MFDDPFFSQPQYFECKQADIDYINHKVSKKILPQRKGVKRVFISGLHIHVAWEACNFLFKGLLHVLNNPNFYYY